MVLSKLYLITDRKQCSDLLWLLEESLKAGLRMIQLREKDLPGSELFTLAQKLRTLTRRYNASLIINDRLDIALAVEADGVHIGQKSMPIKAILKIIQDSNKSLLLGYSAHSLEEARMVEQAGVDWITFSPIFSTPSKKNFGAPQGINILKKVVENLSIPVYALGGIKVNNILEVLETGVHGLALISEIIAAKEPSKATDTILSKL